ncbi:MAG: MerR family transcriptional regulator [Cyanobacteria bacterium J06626_14]
MLGLMKIGELANQTGLSIRTLHYYDEIGLLSPSHRSDVGHRLYSNQDIIRLQQILSLRQLGFSLAEIRECLASPDYALPKVIDLHRSRLREQMGLSYALLGRLDAIARELETTRSVAVEDLIQTMEAITMSEQYFTPEQQAVLESRFREGETEWQDLLTQVRAEMAKGSDLNSPSVRRLARRWLWSMRSFIRDDEEIYTSLTRMYQQEGPTAASWGTMDAATFEYISKAVSFLSLAEFTELLIPTARIFTPKTQQVIEAAKDAMRQIDFHVLGTEAILLGLIAEGKSTASQVLAAAGVQFDVVQSLVVEHLGLGSELQVTCPETTTKIGIGASIPPRRPSYAPRMKRVIELALEEAEQSGEALITPEYLLLGILKEAEEGGGLATYILGNDLGINLTHLEQQLRSAMAS